MSIRFPTLPRHGALFILVALLCVPTVASAQVIDGRYALTAEDARTTLGGAANVRVTLDNLGDPIQGWSFGMCHDPNRLSITAIENGSATRSVKNGAAADFIDVTQHSGGWTTGVIVCLTGCAALPTALDHELAVVTYKDVTGLEGTTDVCFCDRLGSPAVETLVIVGGLSITPVTTCALVEVVDEPPFIYTVARAGGDYTPLDGVGTAVAELAAVQRDAQNGLLTVSAFSMALGHDPLLLTATSIEVSGAAASLNGGAGPEFVGPKLLADGATIGTVFSFTGAATLELPSDTSLVTVAYETVAGAWVGNDTGATLPLRFRNDLGSPAVENVVVVGGNSLDAELVEGALVLEPILGTPFRRGDCNNDTSTNMADGIWLLNYLFSGGQASNCLGACDVDGDTSLGLADAILLLQHTLTSGPPPVAPYPDCGTDEVADCEAYPACL